MTTSDNNHEKLNPAMDSPPATPDKVLRSRGVLRQKVVWIALIVAVIAVAAGIYYYFWAIAHESTEDAYIDGHIIPISPRVEGHVARVYVTDNQKVDKGDLLVMLDSRDFQAQVNAAQAALDAAEAARRSYEIDVNLTSITTTASLEEAEAAVKAAQAMVQNAWAMEAQAKSQQGEAQAQVAFAHAALDQAQAAIDAAEAKYQQAGQDLERYRELTESHTISPQQLDHARTAKLTAAADLVAAKGSVTTQESMLRRAEASLKAAGDNVSQSQAQVTARQAQLGQAKARLASAGSAPEQVSQSSSRAEASRAEVENARAQLEQKSLKLSYAQIHAPADGFVTKKNVEPGAFVQVGQTLLAIVTPDVWVIANFKETQLTHIRKGQSVLIKVDAYPGVVLHGRVDSIQRGTGSRFSLLPPENTTGNFIKVVQRVPVKIVLDQPEEMAGYLLAPGMSVIPEVNVRTAVSAEPAKRAIKNARKRSPGT